MTEHMTELPSLRIFLINLDRATDRLTSMTRTLAEIGLSFERVSAIDGSQLALPVPEFDEWGYRLRHGRLPNTAEIGCYLSHIDCARRLLASEYEFALVLEDDLELAGDLRAVLVAATTTRSWDLLRLSSVSSGKKYGFADLTGRRKLAIAMTREKGSGAYVLNRRAAQWFLDKLLPMKLPFDLAFDMEFGSGIRIAFVDPLPVNQQTGLVSQIQAKRRRSFHLSRWHYVMVLPYRAVMEVCRGVSRFARLIAYRVDARWIHCKRSAPEGGGEAARNAEISI